MRLQGKTALITGASRGIGRSIAELYAREGALVAVHYGNNRAAAMATAAGITAGGGKAFIIQAHLESMTSIENLFRTLDAELQSRTGEARFDILVNNAGVAPRATIEDTNEASYDAAFAINVKGVFFAIRQALPRLRDGGRIINLSSMSARRARPQLPLYAATKAAVDALTLSLAKLLGPRRITVNGIAPGAIETDITAALMRGDDPERRAFYASRSVLGRIGQPEDVARVAAFLASDDAAWITGETIAASGGQEL